MKSGSSVGVAEIHRKVTGSVYSATYSSKGLKCWAPSRLPWPYQASGGEAQAGKAVIYVESMGGLVNGALQAFALPFQFN